MVQCKASSQGRVLHLAVLCLSVLVLAGCTTRQVTKTLEGSTAQRLVTLSIDKFIVALADEPAIKNLEGESVQLGVYFLKDHQLIEYTTQLLTAQLQIIHGITVAEPEESAEIEVDVFFNSIGTDSDDFGLSIPTLGLATTPDGTINILALDMFHGITEGYAIVKAGNGSIETTDRLLARIRRDNVATPIISFPLNQVD